MIFLDEEMDYCGNMESEYDAESQKQQNLIVLDCGYVTVVIFGVDRFLRANRPQILLWLHAGTFLG